MNKEEEAILNDLAKVWNKFKDLPIEHVNERVEFARYIHEAQRMVMCRPTLRAIKKKK